MWLDADIDECSNGSLNSCDQVCVNQQPLFSCECYTGFVLDDNGSDCSGYLLVSMLTICHCWIMLFTDINECDNGVPCHQVCNNVPGSFGCSCNNGFQLDTDNITCIRK